MARVSRRRNKTATAETEQLIAAVKFVGAARKTTGHEFQNYFNIHNGMITFNDSILSAGALIKEDLTCCPDVEQLVSIIDQCATSSSITQVTPELLRISSVKFRGNVDCVGPLKVREAWPDSPQVAITQELIDVLTTLSYVVSNTADKVIMCSVCLSSYVCAATDGGLAAQVYHGLEIPREDVTIPKSFIDLLAKTKKTPAWLGLGDDTLTIFYTDNSWYKTQLYTANWPNIDNVFTNSVSVEYTAVPDDFYVGLTTVKPLTEDNVVYINDNIIASHIAPEKGAFFTARSPVGTFKTNIKHLLLLPKLGIQQYGIYYEHGNEIFYARGVVGSMPIRVAISAME